MKKNVVHPGYVISKNDSGSHFITGETLIRLYKLDPKETIILNPGQRLSDIKGMYSFDLKKLNHFYPSYSGEYR